MNYCMYLYNFVQQPKCYWYSKNVNAKYNIEAITTCISLEEVSKSFWSHTFKNTNNNNNNVRNIINDMNHYFLFEQQNPNGKESLFFRHHYDREI